MKLQGTSFTVSTTMAASMKDERNAGCEWLYPDLLTHSDLLCILKQRFIKEEDLESRDKEYLIELFYKYVIPKPQRKYRLNRRGKLMTKKQIVMAKKRKITSPGEGEPPEKKSSARDGNNSRFISSFKDPSSHDRLKPPPSCINFERKKIKLSSSTSSSSKPNGNTDQVTNEITTSIKTVKIKSENSNQSSQDVKNSSITMKNSIKLINRHLGTSTKSVPNKEKEIMEEGTKTTENKSGDVTKEGETKMETDATEKTEESPKKKTKINRISWP